jgi:hypothetical protein
MRGEGRRSAGASIRLLTQGEGWPTAAHGAVVPVRGARRRRGSARGRRRPKEMGQMSRFGQIDLIFELISRIMSLKSKVSNISNWILNWGQTRISKSKVFEDFSNLELLKIDLNTQIFKSRL